MLALKCIKDVSGIDVHKNMVFGQRKFTWFGFLFQDTMLENALHCLKNVTLDETSLYVKALMAYVFTLSKDMEMRKQLLDMVQKETGRLLLWGPRDHDCVQGLLSVAFNCSILGDLAIHKYTFVSENHNLFKLWQSLVFSDPGNNFLSKAAEVIHA